MTLRQLTLLVTLCMSTVTSWAIPTSITYQGALKDKGVPANGPRQMQFRITNPAGTQVYWSSSELPVKVSNGHFAVQLNPTGIDWESIAPFIEVTIEGQQLAPREPITATVYATLAASVVDEAISPSKVLSGFGLVPAGMIAMFAASCPDGWTHFSALDGYFPVGGAAYGTTGGSSTHSHTLLTAGTVGAGGGNTIGVVHGTNTLGAWSAGSSFSVEVKDQRTDSQPHLPPYRTVVFCQKT